MSYVTLTVIVCVKCLLSVTRSLSKYVCVIGIGSSAVTRSPIVMGGGGPGPRDPQ